MERRIYGIETEFGVTATTNGQRRLTPDEVSRALFRKVVAWGRSSNVFLDNGSRLYLDVGAHPEYATAECDSLLDLVAQDRAGERILDDMTSDAQARLAEDGVDGTIYVFKNNTDSAGNSYGCHENFLLDRGADMNRIAEIFVAFLVSRQLVAGAGKLLVRDGRTVFNLTQRAEHIWDGYSSATTRSRPIINSRDEPHADSARYRRLHVIVGDSTMSEATTLLKVGSAHLVLRMIEAGESFPRLHLANQIQAIRDVSADPTGQCVIELQGGTSMTALAMQHMFLERATAFVEREGDPDPAIADVLDLWGRPSRRSNRRTSPASRPRSNGSSSASCSPTTRRVRASSWTTRSSPNSTSRSTTSAPDAACSACSRRLDACDASSTTPASPRP